MHKWYISVYIFGNEMWGLEVGTQDIKKVGQNFTKEKAHNNFHDKPKCKCPS